MLGLIIDEKEKLELIYVIKRELEEILFDLEDERISNVLKKSMLERFNILISMLQRITVEKDWRYYCIEINNFKKSVDG